MTFEKKLFEFNFNLESLKLFQNDNLNEETIMELMNQSGISNDLSSFLMKTSDSFLSSVMVRLKYYQKNNKSASEVETQLANYKETFPLIRHLFSSEEKVFVSNEDIEASIDLANSENLPSQENLSVNLGEDVVDSSDSEVSAENCLDVFYTNCIIEEDGEDLKTKELYSQFSSWYDKKDYSENEKPDKKEIKKFITEKLGKPSKNTWKNVAVST